MNRKSFMQQVATVSAGIISAPFISYAQDKQEPQPLPAALVKEFVIAGHGNFDKTKQLLLENPTLLYATHDWGNGDFETAIEGAGHVGNKEIANYMIGLGARTNLFVLTMLGKTQIVKAFLETYPQFIQARGPHGLTLLHHAQKGGEDSQELLDYIQSKGLKETKMKL